MSKIRPNRIIKGFAKAVVGDETESAKLRLETCHNCELLKNGICTDCGCVVAAKTKVLEEYCPQNKWHDARVLKSEGMAIINLDPHIVTLKIYDGVFRISYNEKLKREQDSKFKLRIVNDRANHINELSKINLTDVELKMCGCITTSTIPTKLNDGDYFDFDLAYNTLLVGKFKKNIRFKANETSFLIIFEGEVLNS